LDVLGLNPSKEKAMNTLGMEDKDVEIVEQKKVEMYEQECTKKRLRSWVNKKNSSKAIKVLGLELSKDKVMNTLGIKEHEVKEAEEDQIEKNERIVDTQLQKKDP